MPAIAGIIFLIGFLLFGYLSPKIQSSAPLSNINFSHHIPVRTALKDLKKIDTGSAVVFDEQSGYRLLDYNADEVRSIASLTKLMTALVFLDHNPGWDKTITIEEKDLRGGAKANIFVGDRISLKDLFTVSLVASDNSAISALARSTSLDEKAFVAAMNKKAEDLHVRELVFADPTGLNPENKGSALAIAKLVETAFKNKEISQRLRISSFEFSVSKTMKRHITATNQLLGRTLPGQASLIGGKTGHLDEAGYCFAGVFEVNKHRLITVVLGAPLDEKRFSETLKILDWTMRAYLWEN